MIIDWKRQGFYDTLTITIKVVKGKIAVIENEFGDIGLDGELIEADIQIREINAGCICCSLALDFRQGIKEPCEACLIDKKRRK